MKLHPLLMTIFCLVPLGQADAQPKNTDDPAQLAIYAARNTPVRNLASLLAQVLDEDAIEVAAHPSNNLLLMRFRSASPERVLALLKELDRQPRTVLVDAHLLKLDGAPLTDKEAATLSGASEEVASNIDKLKSNERVVVAKHMKIATLENQTTMFQVGEDTVVRSGITTGGRTGYRLENINVGTILKVTARTTPEDVILLNVDFESSEVQPSGDNEEDTPGVSRPGVSTLTHQSTVQLHAGQSRLVGALAGGQPSQTKHAYLVISARIADEPAGERTVSARTFSRSLNAERGVPRRIQASDEGEESSTDARYRKYFRAVIARYDTDQDGQLSSEEWQSMSRNPAAADVDKNGFITLDELVDWQRKR